MYLAEIGGTLYSQSKARSKNYSRQKVKKITEALQHTVITGAPIDDGTEMIQQLKEKFQETILEMSKFKCLQCCRRAGQ